MNRQILEQIVFQFDVLAGVVADLDPDDAQTMTAAVDLAKKLAGEDLPGGLAEDVSQCVSLLGRINTSEGDFQNDYSELCTLLDEIHKKCDSLVSTEVHGDESAGEENVAPELSGEAESPVIDLESEDDDLTEQPVRPAAEEKEQSLDELLADVSTLVMSGHETSDGLSAADADEMRTQVDVIEELLPELASGAAHVFGVVSDLFIKIEKLESLPQEARRMALAAAGSAQAAASSEIEPMRAEATIRATVLQLMKELDAAAGIVSETQDEEDQTVRAGRDMLSGNFMDQTVVLIENLESDMLSFEGGSMEALSRILILLRELRGRAESLGFGNVATFLSEIRSFLNSAGGAAGGEAFNLLLDAKDLLSEFLIPYPKETTSNSIRKKLTASSMRWSGSFQG